MLVLQNCKDVLPQSLPLSFFKASLNLTNDNNLGSCQLSPYFKYTKEYNFFFLALSLNIYTFLNESLYDCMKKNQTCSFGMNKCFSMQKEALSGEYRYSKFCANEWDCERYDAACEDLDDPEYSYLECNIGCCTSDLCNGAQGNMIFVSKSIGLLFIALFTVIALHLQW